MPQFIFQQNHKIGSSLERVTKGNSVEIQWFQLKLCTFNLPFFHFSL